MASEGEDDKYTVLGKDERHVRSVYYDRGFGNETLVELEYEYLGSTGSFSLEPYTQWVSLHAEHALALLAWLEREKPYLESLRGKVAGEE